MFYYKFPKNTIAAIVLLLFGAIATNNTHAEDQKTKRPQDDDSINNDNNEATPPPTALGAEPSQFNIIFLISEEEEEEEDQLSSQILNLLTDIEEELQEKIEALYQQSLKLDQETKKMRNKFLKLFSYLLLFEGGATLAIAAKRHHTWLGTLGATFLAIGALAHRKRMALHEKAATKSKPLKKLLSGLIYAMPFLNLSLYTAYFLKKKTFDKHKQAVQAYIATSSILSFGYFAYSAAFFKAT